MKKVILFQLPYSEPVLGPPVGLLSLGGVLRPEGYQVRIIDGAVEADYLSSLEREIPDALCLGVSLLTGPMIRTASDAAQRVREIRPSLPIVFGGWHPSLLPDQTLRERYVDVVVRNQGEWTFLEVVRRFESARALDGLAGTKRRLAAKRSLITGQALSPEDAC